MRQFPLRFNRIGAIHSIPIPITGLERRNRLAQAVCRLLREKSTSPHFFEANTPLGALP
jgi:hypothetical protein